MNHSFTRHELYDLIWTEPIKVLAERLGLSDVGLGFVEYWDTQIGANVIQASFLGGFDEGRSICDHGSDVGVDGATLFGQTD